MYIIHSSTKYLSWSFLSPVIFSVNKKKTFRHSYSYEKKYETQFHVD